jgi:hypothetical protein
MNLADQQLSTVRNSTSIQEAKVFVRDAIQSLQQNQDANAAKNAGNPIVTISINNLNTSLTPDQYLNRLMQQSANQPNIKFTTHTTSNVVLAGHPGYLLVGTFKRDPTGALEGFTNIGTIIGNKAYSIQYYSPEQTYPIYRTTYNQMIRSFELIPPYTCPLYIMYYSKPP